jgi:hypothetical protein
MARRVLSSRLLPNALLLVLTLGGLTLGACAYEHPSPPGYAWHYLEDGGDGPKLAYGRPNSDDVLMMMACAPGASAMTLTATDLSGNEIALASDRRVTRLKAQTIASETVGEVLQARTSVDAAALSAFRRTGDLDLLIADERHSLDAAPADRRDVKAFFKACSVS